MIRALYTAATGMQAQQLNIDVIANNLANVNTAGFKKSRADFQDLLYQNNRPVGSTSSDIGTIVPAGVQVGLGVRTAAVYRISEQGNMSLTDNSLDLLVRCGLKYSRGKDQLMCYGENMPLDVLLVRDDDIPDLVQQDVCDLGIVGLNVIEEKRLAFAARGITPLFNQVMVLDFGKCRMSIAVPDGVLGFLDDVGDAFGDFSEAPGTDAKLWLALGFAYMTVITGICLVVERDPITTAKEVATLDLLSGGRFLFGVGGGWNREEMENHGTDPGRRFAVLRERVLAMKEIWTQEAAEFHGEHVDFDPLWQWPKPVQQPHPPVLVAGNGPGTLERVLDYGDGWLPNDHDEVGNRIAATLALTFAAAACGGDEETCDLLELAVDEALDDVIAALDRATLAGTPFLRIIHGHGTGKLKSSLRGYLKDSPYVVRFRSGDRAEGGDGATIATLR